MAVLTTIYAAAVNAILSKKVDFLGDNIYVALMSNAYTPDTTPTGDDFWDDISAQEITGTGYTAHGYHLVNKTLTYDSGTHLWTATNTVDPTWAGLTITNCRYAVLWDNTGTDSTSPLIQVTDFGADQTITADTFTLHIPSTGLFQTSQTTG